MLSTMTFARYDPFPGRTKCLPHTTLTEAHQVSPPRYLPTFTGLRTGRRPLPRPTAPRYSRPHGNAHQVSQRAAPHRYPPCTCPAPLKKANAGDKNNAGALVTAPCPCSFAPGRCLLSSLEEVRHRPSHEVESCECVVRALAVLGTELA